MGTRTETNFTIGGNLHVEGNITVDGSHPDGTFPGEIRMDAGSSAPSGWLACDGSAVSRTTYAAMFGRIGTTYGAGDGSTTFNLPDLSARVPMGPGGGFSAGDSGGSASHDLSHTHTAYLPQKAAEENAITGSDFTGWPPGGAITTQSGLSTIDNRQPYITLNFIIRT